MTMTKRRRFTKRQWHTVLPRNMMYAIFWKSRGFNDIKYGNKFLPNIFHQNKFSTCLLIAEDLSFAQFTWSSFPKSFPVYGSIKSEFRHKLDIRIWDAREFTQSDNNSQTAASMTKWSNMFQTAISIGYDLGNSNVGKRPDHTASQMVPCLKKVHP